MHFQFFTFKDLNSLNQNEIKKTVVIGASSNPSRYSHTAVLQLTGINVPVIPIGIKNEMIGNIEILTGFPEIENVHTVTMYVGPKKQPQYYDYILNRLKPKRIIFNPGTENKEFEELAIENNIKVMNYCTLIMISNGTF